MNRKLTASLLILAAVLANVGFTALGSIFNYPDVLDEPAGEVLAAFRDHEGAVSALVRGPRALRRAARSDRDRRRPALVARAPCGSRCRSGSRRPSCRSSACCAGRSSCPATRPTRQRQRRRRARDSFTTASDILGTAIGETLGYLLTATWTVLVIVALGRRYAGRWFQVLGAVSAALVLVGVLSPLGLPVIDTANFFGYVLWSVWLIAFAVVILVHERRARRAVDARRSPSAVTS